MCFESFFVPFAIGSSRKKAESSTSLAGLNRLRLKRCFSKKPWSFWASRKNRKKVWTLILR